ncbi:LysR family transcriptional regulator [Klebsiella grimontii]|uniref:LysR family transcriptional regulator n=1 Tax=Klebsiella grimontii TaxID=2058152 RepID=A0A7H4P291_9ENTR|nr:LysR family transcriptional regulator [Klebsiella grimontii]
MRIDDIDALLATVQFSSLNQAADILVLPNRRLPVVCSVWNTPST